LLELSFNKQTAYVVLTYLMNLTVKLILVSYNNYCRTNLGLDYVRHYLMKRIMTEGTQTLTS